MNVPRLPITLLIATLTASVALNGVLYSKTRRLEARLWGTALRLGAFVDATNHVIRQARITREDLERSNVLPLPADEGPGYVVAWDPHYGFGVRFEFGATGLLEAWREVPPLPLRTERAGQGSVLRSPREYACTDDGIDPSHW